MDKYIVSNIKVLYTCNKHKKIKYKLRTWMKKGERRSYFLEETKQNYLVKKQKTVSYGFKLC